MLKDVLTSRTASGTKARTTLYVGKDCPPELAIEIANLAGYKVQGDILNQSGTAIFTASLYRLESAIAFIHESGLSEDFVKFVQK